MKEAIHPDYKAAKIICNCGNVIETRSTRGDFHIEICAACHPFFTGKQKIMDTAGRIERFKTRYASTPGQPAAKVEAKPAAPAAKKAEPKENRAAKRAKAGKSKPKTEAAPAAAEAAPAAPAAAEPKE